MAVITVYIFFGLITQSTLTVSESHAVTRQAVASPSSQTCPLPESAIFVNPVNGTRNASCWSGGRENPCNSVSRSIQGGKETNRSVALLPGSYRKSGHCICDTVTDFACNSWFQPMNGTCICGHGVHHAVKCDQASGSVKLLIGYCMTYDNDRNETVVGACIFNYMNNNSFTLKDSPYRNISPYPTSINEEICGHYNRTGQFCGDCKVNYSIPAYSYDLSCVICKYNPYNWVLYILAAFGPLTLLYIIIFIFRINLAAPPFTAFVQLCQTLASPTLVRILSTAFHLPGFSRSVWLSKSVLTVYGIWNLDFFRLLVPPICLQLNPLPVMALDYLVACYPLLLVVITYLLIVAHDRKVKVIVWLTKPFRTCSIHFRHQGQDLKLSAISTFVSFFLLSYVKLISVSGDLLLPTKVYYLNGTSKWILFNLATVEYFGGQHLPYAILAIGIIVIFIILPLVLLLLYPCRWFQQLLGYCHLHSHMLQTFTDAFQGCYKDGTNGTYDCRYFSAAYLILRVLSLVIYGLTKSVFFWPLLSLMMIAFSILLVVLQPYKHSLHNKADSALILMAAALYVSILSLNVSSVLSPSKIMTSLVLAFIFGLFPLLWATVMSTYWITVRKRYHRLAFERMKQLFLKYRHRHSRQGGTTHNSINLTELVSWNNSYLIEPLVREEESQQ